MCKQIQCKRSISYSIIHSVIQRFVHFAFIFQNVVPLQVPSTQLHATPVIPATLNIGVFQPLQAGISPIIVNLDKSVLLQKPITSTPNFPNRRKTFVPFKRRTLSTRGKRTRSKIKDPISKFVECLSRPSMINQLFPTDCIRLPSVEEIKNNCTNKFLLNTSLNTMLPSMPSLGTPIKKCFQNEALSSVTTDIDINEGKILTNAANKSENKKSVLPEISTISSSSFQQANSNTEVEFCRPTDSCQAVTCHTESTLRNLPSNHQQMTPTNSTPQDSVSLEKVSNLVKQYFSNLVKFLAY